MEGATEVTKLVAVINLWSLNDLNLQTNQLLGTLVSSSTSSHKPDTLSLHTKPLSASPRTTMITRPKHLLLSVGT